MHTQIFMTKFLKISSALCFVLVSIISTSSCTKIDPTLGLDMLPGDEVLMVADTVFSDDMFSLRNERDSLMMSSGQYNYYFGFVNDPIVGYTNSSLAAQFLPYYTGMKFKTGAVMDSCYLVMPLLTTFNSDPNRYNVKVYQLSDSLRRDSFPYYGSEFPIRNYYKESDLVSEPFSLSQDSAWMRIRLKNSFGNYLMACPDSVQEYGSTFINYLKGLYIKMDSSLTNPGFMKQVALTTSSYTPMSYIRVYYSYPSADTMKDSTAIYVVDINSVRTAIYHNKLNTHISNAYYPLSSMAGYSVRMTVDTVKLKQWAQGRIAKYGGDVNKWKVAINKAQLILPVQDSTNYVKLNRYSKLGAAAIYHDSIYTNVIDSYSSYFDGSLNRSKMEYSMLLTTSIQNMVNTMLTGSGVRNYFLLTHSDKYTPAYSYIQSFQGKRKPRIKVTYSILRK